MGVAQVKVLGDAPQRLRMTEKEESARRERTGDTSNSRGHRVLPKVHHHVSAEDDVERVFAPKRRVVIREVSFLERGHCADIAIQLEVATAGPEVATCQLGGCVAQGPRRIDSPSRL